MSKINMNEFVAVFSGNMLNMAAVMIGLHFGSAIPVIFALASWASAYASAALLETLEDGELAAFWFDWVCVASGLFAVVSATVTLLK